MNGVGSWGYYWYDTADSTDYYAEAFDLVFSHNSDFRKNGNLVRCVAR